MQKFKKNKKGKFTNVFVIFLLNNDDQFSLEEIKILKFMAEGNPMLGMI